jgi:hypothetical protein
MLGHFMATGIAASLRGALGRRGRIVPNAICGLLSVTPRDAEERVLPYVLMELRDVGF